MWRDLLFLSLVACSGQEQKTDGDDDDNGDDDDDTTPGCAGDDTCEPFTICDAEAGSPTEGECILGDRSNAPAEAVPLVLSEDLDALQRVEAMIAPPGDVDYFSYESRGEEWVSFRTETDNGRAAIDTYVTVTDPSGNVHATLDNYPTGLVAEPLDTVLYTFLPEAGTYTFAVEDVTTAAVYSDLFDEEEWRGDESMTYRVHIRPAAGVAEPDDATSALTVSLTSGTSITALGVRMEEAGDVDFVTLSTSVVGEPLEVWVQPSRPASTADAQLRLFDAEGNLIADKRAGDGTEGYLSYFAPQAADYLLEATTADGEGGDEAWYVLYIRTYEPESSHPFFGTSSYAFELEPNDVRDDATPLVPEDAALDDGTPYFVWYAEGTVDVDGDVDAFEVQMPAGHQLSSRCFTERFGSLAELTVSVFEGAFDVTPDGQGQEPTALEYYVYNVDADGPTTLQIEGVPGVFDPGAYYRCVVFGTPFALDEDSL